MTEGRISPWNVFRIPKLVMVTKFVMITSSLGIIISDRNRRNAIFLPRNSSLANAKAARVITTTMMAVVRTVNTIVFTKYRPRGTDVKAST